MYIFNLLRKKLSFKVFSLLLVFLIIPMYAMFTYVKTSYENYICQELSNQIVRNMAKSEQDIYQAFNQMASISNLFCVDRELVRVFQDPYSSKYDRAVALDRTVANIAINNLFTMRDFKVTLFDTANRCYANWSINYNDYSFMLEQDFIRESIESNGHIRWSLFSPTFDGQSNSGQRYISLARSILSDGSSGERVATVVISLNQDEIGAMLSGYLSDDSDFIYLSTADTARIVLRLDGVQTITQQDIERLLSSMTLANGNVICDVAGTRYLLNYYRLEKPWTFENEPLYLMHFTNYQQITDTMQSFSRSISLSMMAFVVVLMLIMALISYMIANPIKELDQKVEQYAMTREVSALDTNRRDEIGGLNRTFFYMQIKINELFAQLKEESEIRELYHFKALRAQINPHFLFNTLNTIRWMALIRKADNIVDTIDALAKMLQYSMDREGELITLGEELDMIVSYASIQNYRYGEDYRVDILVPPELRRMRTIKFIIQPIVENAFIHAFKGCKGKKVIAINASIDKDKLYITVQDNGNGIPAGTADPLQREEPRDRRKTTGIGLRNVDERIRTEYGEGYGLSLQNAEEGGTRVCYTLPVIEEAECVETDTGGG